MTSPEPQVRPTKLCFVTVGATASFNALVKEVLDTPFLEALQANHYTDVMIQYGEHGIEIFHEFTAAHGNSILDKYGLFVTGFDFNLDGLKQEIMSVKADREISREEGVVISHAGELNQFMSGRLLS
jgi:beta-1,4-N-acetylglucosaminyltransferase